MTARILIVDDEKNIRRTLSIVLKGAGHDVREAGSAEEAETALDHTPAEVVLLDIGLPGRSGLEFLEAMKPRLASTAFIMISGQATVSIAVEAVRHGAFDFLEKPLSKDRVLIAVKNALRVARMGAQIDALRERGEEAPFLGDSEPMRELKQRIAKVAPTHATVLITGESGVGKEVVSRAIHAASPVADGPFIKVNCAAIPEELIETELFGCVKGAYTGADRSRDGKFILADGGTLFLDEIGDMSLRVQAKVLRALQEKEIERVGDSQTLRVDVRVLAATNKDLLAEAAADRFREDLYYRLAVVPLHVPPLRERPDDIKGLARHFLASSCVEMGLSPREWSEDALDELGGRPWRGNVRELRNVVERVAILADGPVLTADDVRATGAGSWAIGGRCSRRRPGLCSAEWRKAGRVVSSFPRGHTGGGRFGGSSTQLRARRHPGGAAPYRWERLPSRAVAGHRTKQLAQEDPGLRAGHQRPRRRHNDMRPITSLVLSIFLLACLGASTPARAQDDDLGIWHQRGFRAGLSLHGSAIGTEPAEDETGGDHVETTTIEERGGGATLHLGYGFTPAFVLWLDLSGSVHETSLDAVEGRLGSGILVAQWMFQPQARTRPYLIGGLGGTSFRVDEGDLEVEIEGGTAVLGGGLQYSMSRVLSLDVRGRLDFINWNKGTARIRLDGGQSIEVSVPFDDSGVASKLAIGIVAAF